MNITDAELEKLATRIRKLGYKDKMPRDGFDPEEDQRQIAHVLNGIRSMRVDGIAERRTFAAGRFSVLKIGPREARRLPRGWRSDTDAGNLWHAPLEDALRYLLETADQRQQTVASGSYNMGSTPDEPRDVTADVSVTFNDPPTRGRD